jgi:hypothetical protein
LYIATDRSRQPTFGRWPAPAEIGLAQAQALQCDPAAVPQCDPTDSPVANCFRQACPGRWCAPGQVGSATCLPLVAPRPIRRVVIHTIASPDMTTIVNRTATVLGRGTSSHYYVYRNGCIIQMVREANVAFHGGSPPVNRDSIGIEHADLCNRPHAYTTQLYERSAQLVRDIARRNGFAIRVFGIDTNNLADATVVAHSHVDASGDPGPYWDWEYFWRLLNWDFGTEARRPLRVVSMIAAGAAAPAGWETRTRVQVLSETRNSIPNSDCANRNHSYSDAYWRARPNTPGSNVVFQFNLPRAGTYKASLWWPNVSGANPETRVQIEVQKAGGPARADMVVNQRRSYGRWNEIGQPFTVPAGGAQVTVQILRSSRELGWILADAARILKVR